MTNDVARSDHTVWGWSKRCNPCWSYVFRAGVQPLRSPGNQYARLWGAGIHTPIIRLFAFSVSFLPFLFVLFAFQVLSSNWLKVFVLLNPGLEKPAQIDRVGAWVFVKCLGSRQEALEFESIHLVVVSSRDPETVSY